MPLWNDDKAKSYKAKLEHKMCYAKDTPEPCFDLADCNLSEVPSGVFSMCRVFLKQSLHFENNRLTSLQNGGSLKDLSGILVLHLQNNRFSSLPNDIHHLVNLTDLNLENNQLKKLPATFSKLEKLKLLNLKGNRLVEFPPVICSLVSLESLNVCNNPKIQRLPPELSNLAKLKCLQLDALSMLYPSAEICKRDTQHIMKFLLSESGKDSNFSESVSTESCDNIESRDPLVSSPDLSESCELYYKTKQERQQNLLLMEKALKQNSELQAKSVSLGNARRQSLLLDIMKDQERIENELSHLQNEKDKERQQNLEMLLRVEDYSAEMISHLKDWNKTFLDLQKDEEKHLKLQNLLKSREEDKKALLDAIVQEDMSQKEAFKAARVQRDSLHKEISVQIRLIEKELAKLTVAEIKRRNLEINNEVNRLAESRTTLADMLSDLLLAKLKREQELKEILDQIEKDKMHEAEDYWLLQYQKVLSQKPASMEDQIPDKDTDSQNLQEATQKYFSSNEDAFPRLSEFEEVSPSAPVEEEFEFLQPTAPLFSPDSEKRLWLQADCVICLDAQSSSVFLPCGHVCCCQNCYMSVDICPMCRTTIETKFILYNFEN